jgi:hypothetical protein
MRKIETKKEAERKSKRNQQIVGGILIFIMLGSTFGYVVCLVLQTTLEEQKK